jgi:hypothetical protein
MSTGVGVKESRRVWEPPSVHPLDEAVWQVWKAKGREQDRRRGLDFNTVVRCGAITALLIVVGLGAQVAPHALLARLVVAASAVTLVVQAMQARQVLFAAAFGLIAALYNPMAPAFDFSSTWERAFVAASAVLFLAPLLWREMKGARHA